MIVQMVNVNKRKMQRYCFGFETNSVISTALAHSYHSLYLDRINILHQFHYTFSQVSLNSFSSALWGNKIVLNLPTGTEFLRMSNLLFCWKLLAKDVKSCPGEFNELVIVLPTLINGLVTFSCATSKVAIEPEGELL